MRDWLLRQRVAFVEDPTNSDLRYTRNRIRARAIRHGVARDGRDDRLGDPRDGAQRRQQPRGKPKHECEYEGGAGETKQHDK